MPDDIPQSSDDLIPAKVAARHLNISNKTLRRKYQGGEIEYLQIGRLVKFTEAALEAYKRRKTVAPRTRGCTTNRRRRA